MIKIKILFIALLSVFFTSEVKVIATVYNAVESQCNSDYWHTATMFKLDTINPYKHRIVAVSRDLEKLGFIMNSIIMIYGTDKYDGEWIIRDRMNIRYTKRIDFLINENMGLGKWNNVTIKLKSNDIFRRGDNWSQYYKRSYSSNCMY